MAKRLQYNAKPKTPATNLDSTIHTREHTLRTLDNTNQNGEHTRGNLVTTVQAVPLSF